MNSEPTLGQRIEAAADAAAEAGDVCGYGSDAFSVAESVMLGLCEMASAAERLAKAADVAAEDREINDWSYNAQKWAEFNAALKAWREGGQ